MRKYLFFLLSIFCFYSGYSQNRNVEVLGHLAYTNPNLHGDLSDIWGHVDSLGNEYAIIGLEKGVSIVDVTDPSNLVEVFYVAGPSTIWRDVKTWNNHAYITNEASGGLQIIDMSALPGTITSSDVYYHTGTNYPFTEAHNLYIDENGVAYIFGPNYNQGGAIFLDLTTDPKLPQEVGVFDSLYFHDGMVRGDTLWAAAVFAGKFFVIDVSTKSNPIILKSNFTSGFFAHNCWISDDGNTLFTTDEISGGYISSYDVSDLSNVDELDIIQSNPGSLVIPHNTHVHGDFLVTSYYRDGVTIIDASQPDRMVQTGNYDTSPMLSGDGFNGAWGVYPYLPSGNVIASDIENGLYVLGVNYQKGVYIKGNTRSFEDSSQIGLTLIKHLNSGENFQSNLNGFYKESYADTGWHQFAFFKGGYLPDTLDIYMQEGQIYNGDIYLRKNEFYTVSGTVYNASNDPVAGASVVFDGKDRYYRTTTNSSGYYEIDSVYQGPYELVGGKFGYNNSCNVVPVTGNETYNIYLDQGYYDDMTVDAGWSASSTGTASNGNWEIEYLNARPNIAELTHPKRDVSDDCSRFAFVTESAHSGDHDVDGAKHIIESPVFDPNNIEDVHLHLSYWFYNDGAGDEDSLNVFVETTSSRFPILEIHNSSVQASSVWVDTIFDLMSLSIADQAFKLIVEVGDYGQDDHLEAGIDHVYVFDRYLAVNEFNGDDNFLLFPNPFSSFIQYTLPDEFEGSVYKVYDLNGKEILQGRIQTVEGRIENIGNIDSGIYLIQFISPDGQELTQKLIKDQMPK